MPLLDREEFLSAEHRRAPRPAQQERQGLFHGPARHHPPVSAYAL